MKLAALVTLAVMATKVFATTCPEDRELKVTVPNEGKLSTMAAVHAHLLACPAHIDSLDLETTVFGCSDWPDRFNFPFDMSGGETYPTLRSLRLKGYRFDERPWRRIAQKSWFWNVETTWEKVKAWVSVPVSRRDLSNLDLWIEAMDWTQLERLELVDGLDERFAIVLGPELASLKDLTLSSDRSPAHAANLITSLPRPHQLVNLTWTDGFDPERLGEVVQLQGASLKRLELYTKEPWCSIENATLDPAQIRALGQGAPQIEHLSLSLDRDGDWPWDVLDAIAESTPNVKTLDLWLELTSDSYRGRMAYPTRAYRRGVDQEMRNASTPEDDGYRRPLLNATSASEVYEYLRDRKVGAPLETVDFRVGDWNGPWQGPIYTPSWLEGRNGRVVCNANATGGNRCVQTEDSSSAPIDYDESIGSLYEESEFDLTQ